MEQNKSQTNPMMIVRSLKGSPASVLWALVLVRHAMSARELVAYTGYKLDAIREAMTVLAGYKIVVEGKRAHGESVWALGDGIQFLLTGIDPRALDQAGLSLPGQEDGQNQIKTDSGAGLVVEEIFQNQIKTDSGNGEIRQSWIKSDSESKKRDQNRIKSDSGAQNQGSINLIDDDESLSNKTINHHQSEPENQKLARILENTGILWGDHLTIEDVPAGTSPDLALAWICKIWVDLRSGNDVKNPTGLLRSRLRSGSHRRILHDDLLPNEYRLAIGLPVIEVLPQHSQERLEQVIEESRDNLRAEQAEQEAIRAKLDQAVPAQVRESWRAWINGLDAPRAWIETWLDDTSPVRWDGRTLTVAARNEFAVNWLAERFSSCRILGIDADLKFVCIHDWLEA